MAHEPDPSDPRPQDAQRDAQIRATLAPPGAGIPWVNRQILRFVLRPFVVRRVPWETSEIRFTKAHRRLISALDAFPPAHLTQRVLVPPMQGLEDSSRYWSAAMVVDHLTIVGTQICGAIVSLSRGIVPPVKADTAQVKPPIATDAPAVIAGYVGFGDHALAKLQRDVADRQSMTTLRHPWFGPLTAKDWLWLLGTHTTLHRKQLEAIQAGLVH